MLDRATGKPLYGIPEKPVPQNAAQKTWPTQPIPDNGAFTPHGAVPAKDVARVKKQAVGPLAKVPVVVQKVPFTPPPPGKLLIYGNGPQGGVNWQPISYNQKTKMIYVCSSVSWVGFLAETDALRAAGPELHRRRAARPASPGPKAAAPSPRSTRRAARPSGRRHSPSPATPAPPRPPATSSSSAATAASSRPTTPPAATSSGASRPAPARTTPPTIFQQDGKQYVAFLAGGNSLAATPHGDNLWLFALDGTLGPAAAPGKGTGTAARRRGRRQEDATRHGQRGRRQDRLRRQLRLLPRRPRPRRQRRPRPDGDPEREELQDRRRAGRRTAAAACPRSRAS